MCQVLCVSEKIIKFKNFAVTEINTLIMANVVWRVFTKKYTKTRLNIQQNPQDLSVSVFDKEECNRIVYIF